MTRQNKHLPEATQDENISALLLLAGKIPEYLVVSESGILVE
ncbi:hypothetical protein [Okeania sp. KiyG1]|nr:hypothetical protein [Okeania sp. KiyG1]